MSLGLGILPFGARRVAYNEQMAPAERATPRGCPSPSDGKPRILAIDYGRKRFGLALSDELSLTAMPLAILARTNRSTDTRRLREICRQHAVGRIIVGYPLHLTGEEGNMAREAAVFSRRLRKQLGIETELVDERLTSWEAEQTVTGRKPGRRKRQVLDDVAAAVLLRDYLDRKVGPKPADAVGKD